MSIKMTTNTTTARATIPNTFTQRGVPAGGEPPASTRLS
jgi:hypothetical protein